MTNVKSDLRHLLKEKYHLTDFEILNNKYPNSKEFNADYKLLKNGYPLAYIIGYVEFIGCKIDLSYKTLIPRPETEYWVDKVLNSLNHNISYNILDMYSGSGCIGISCLKLLPFAKVTFCDIDQNCQVQIKTNLKINDLENRAEVIKSNRFSNIKLKKYDLIFANPPYVKTDYKSTTLKYEPSIAIFSDNNGLAEINLFLADVQNHLNQNGKIFLEFGFGQKTKIKELLIKYKFKDYQFYKDQYNKYRYMIS